MCMELDDIFGLHLRALFPALTALFIISFGTHFLMTTDYYTFFLLSIKKKKYYTFFLFLIFKINKQEPLYHHTNSHHMTDTWLTFVTLALNFCNILKK